MKGEPRIEQRREQHYVGTRTVMPMSDFASAIPAMTTQVSEELRGAGLRATGKPFLRYHTIDMPDRMDVELGIPTNGAPRAGGKLETGVLPAGKYAVLTYKGAKNGVPANKQLLDWVAAHDEAPVKRISAKGEVFESRYETFLDDAPATTPPDELETEVAIKLRD